MMENYRQPSDLPSRIPIFPLRGAIMLPRATLPLNIFEPRYLQMIADVMAGDRVIGIIQPKATGDNEGVESPKDNTHPLQKVGCAGRVTAYQELENAQVMISLTGVARFEVLTEPPGDTPYRTADVNYDPFSADFTAGLGEAQVDREKLLEVLKSYLDANKLSADWDNIGRASSEQLINALSVMSPFSAEEKQALLEARTLKARADILIALAEMAMASGNRDVGSVQ